MGESPDSVVAATSAIGNGREGDVRGEHGPSVLAASGRGSAVSLPTPGNTAWGWPALPEWVKELRPHQEEAILAIGEAFDRGAKVVWLDAPTGSGKTLIAECTRRILQCSATYICSSLTLQDQFQRDFTYANVLKGRSNYPTVEMPFPDYTCADCTKQPRQDDSCLWCPSVRGCPYERAKIKALRGELAIVNTAYFLAEANYVGALSEQQLVIADECDMLEQALMGFVEFRITNRMLRELGINAPKKGSHRETIADWLANECTSAIARVANRIPRDSPDIHVIRDRQRFERLSESVDRLAGEVANDNWIRDYDDRSPLVLKPVTVSEYGHKYLWDHSARWLCMSATIISADEMAASLGLAHEWEVVRVPMTFDKDNRRIYVTPVANMVAAEKEQEIPKLLRGIAKLCDRHQGERILIHSVSYDLTDSICRILSDGPRRVFSYSSAEGRAGAISSYLQSEDGILVAPSLERGIDFKGNDCRVCIVAKVPFPYLGDRQISERLHTEGGNYWYAVQTVRSLVQMTGRGVRSEDDWCVTYILDKQFLSNVMKKSKGLLPKWWAEALDKTFPMKEIVGARRI